MADAVTLIVLVAASEASSPTTRAMTHAMHEALGPGAHVIVHETSGDPTDTDALAAERKEGSDAVVELVWGDARHKEATLRVHIARNRHWLERSIGFRPSDAEAERGRTLGFAVASILPEAEAPTAPPESPPPDRSSPGGGSATPGPSPAGTAEPPATGPAPGPPAGPPTPPAPLPPTTNPSPPPTATPPAAPAPPQKEAPSAPRATTPAPAPSPAPAEAAPKPAPPPSPTAAGTAAPPRAPTAPIGWFETAERPSSAYAGVPWPTVSLDLLATGDWVPRSFGYGGMLAPRWFPFAGLPWLSFLAAAGGSYGTLNLGETFNWWVVRGWAGVALHPLRSSLDHPFGFEVRVYGDLMYLSVKPSNPSLVLVANQHPSPSHVNGGPEAVADVTWELGRGFDVIAGGGAAYTVIHDSIGVLRPSVSQETLFPRVRVLFEAGFRVSF